MPIPAALRGATVVAGVYYPKYRLFVLALGIVVFALLWLLLNQTRLGALIRAGVDDTETIEAMGVAIRLVFLLTFTLGSALAGLGGVVGGAFLTLYPGADAEILVFSLAVVIIGGRGSLVGAAVGALLVGLLNAFGQVLFPELAGVLAGLGTLPMANVPAAIAEAKRGASLGLPGYQIDSRVNRQELSDPAFDPLWECLAGLGAVMVIHPLGFSDGARLGPFFMVNTVDQPLEETIAFHRLVLDGVLPPPRPSRARLPRRRLRAILSRAPGSRVEATPGVALPAARAAVGLPAPALLRHMRVPPRPGRELGSPGRR